MSKLIGTLLRVIWPQLFFDEVKAAGIAPTLLAGRPRKQRAQDLQWKPDLALPISNVTELFVNGVCQVRNHVVHRQKFRGAEADNARDLAVVEESIRILQLVLAKKPEFQKHL